MSTHREIAVHVSIATAVLGFGLILLAIDLSTAGEPDGLIYTTGLCAAGLFIATVVSAVVAVRIPSHDRAPK